MQIKSEKKIYLFIYLIIYSFALMKITATLKSLTVGQSLIFDIGRYDSILAINTRLKRKGEGEFKTKLENGNVTVTREK